MSNLRDVKSRTVEITLQDGVTRTLKYDLNAMAELEELYGDVDAVFAKLEKGSFKSIRSVLWAGLLHEDPTLTEQQVGSLIDIASLQDLTTVLSGALESDLPTEQTTEQTTKAQATVVGVANPN